MYKRFLVVNALLWCSIAEAKTPVVVREFPAKVVAVTDGDTIKVLTADKAEVKIRLEGIDAPESRQDHGAKAKAALSDLAFSRDVLVRQTGTDRYGRVLAFVDVAGEEVNARLVRDGWAWHYCQFNSEDRLEKLESEARAAKRGLWAHPDPVAPWEWRKRPKGSK